MPSDPSKFLAERALLESAWVRRLAGRLVGDSHLAEDLGQEALLAALRRGDGARERRAWLSGAVHNLTRLHRRRERHRDVRERRAARAEAVPSPEDALGRAEMQQRVVAAVLRLEEPYRSTILLRYLEDLPVEDVAHRMDVPASTVRVRTKRALARLERALVAEHGDDREVFLASMGFLAGTPSESAIALATGTPVPTLVLGSFMSVNTKLITAFLLGALALGWWWQGRGDAGGTGDVASLPNVAVPDRDAADDEPETLSKLDVTVPAVPRQLVSNTVVQAAESAPLSPPGGDATLEGRVVDSAGQALGGVRVALFAHAFRGRVPATGTEPADGQAPILNVTTSREGTFHFEGLRAHTEYGVLGRAAGFTDGSANARAGEKLELRMLPRVRLHGRVLAADGVTPVPAVEIVATKARERRFAPLTTLSGADGRYAFSALGADSRVELRVHASDGLPFEFQVRLAPSGDTEHDLRLPERAWFQGVVIDADSGRPIAGAGLFAGPTRRRIGASDTDGRFRIGLSSELLRAAERRSASPIQVLHGESVQGSYLAASLVAHAEGYAWTSAPLWIAAAGAEAEFRIPLARAGRITGRVTYTDGTPAAGVWVGWKEAPMLFLADGAVTVLAPGERSLATDAEGGFAMESATCDPDRTGLLEVRSAQLDPIEIADASPSAAGETRHHEVVLEERAVLHGRLLVNGQPEFGYVYVVGPGDDLRHQVETDALGHFQVRSLAPGVHVLRACTGDGTAVFSEEHVVEMPHGDEHPFEIRIEADFHTVSGRVVDRGGRPVAGQSVVALTQERRGAPGNGSILAATTRSAADGRFELRLEPLDEPGPVFYTIKSFLSGWAMEVSDVTAGRADLEFIVPELVPVSLRFVERATGEPITAVRLAWHDPSSGARAVLSGGLLVETTSEGVLSVQLPVGPIDLEVSSAGVGTREERPLRVPPEGFERGLTFELGDPR